MFFLYEYNIPLGWTTQCGVNNNFASDVSLYCDLRMGYSTPISLLAPNISLEAYVDKVYNDGPLEVKS